jgi:hypothetical protein
MSGGPGLWFLLNLFIFHQNLLSPSLIPSIPASKRQKDDFAKINVRFCKFISNLVRFWSKTMSNVLGKVDAFWMYQLLQA